MQPRLQTISINILRQDTIKHHSTIKRALVQEAAMPPLSLIDSDDRQSANTDQLQRARADPLNFVSFLGFHAYVATFVYHAVMFDRIRSTK